MGTQNIIRHVAHIHKKEFDILMGVKSLPNEREILLFHRAQKYIQKLRWIPGIQMVAIVNSLSMYATHEDSDIDLFIVTREGMLWFVRFIVTIEFYFYGVWRHGEDIRGNFCLSFFITTGALSMEKVAIENDIYLYYWIYFMKPIFDRDSTYDAFLGANSWVNIPPKQKEENQQFPEKNLKSEQVSNGVWKIYSILNTCIRFFWKPLSQNSAKKLGNPEGIILSENMLKFHDQDRRKEIRETILKNNFDK